MMLTMQEKSVIQSDATNHNDLNKMQANLLAATAAAAAVATKRDTNIDLVAQMTKTLATMTTDAASSNITHTLNNSGVVVVDNNKLLDAKKALPAIVTNNIQTATATIIQQSSSPSTPTSPMQTTPTTPPTSHHTTQPPLPPQANVIVTRPTKRTANDYRFGKTIGEGSFSTVYLAKDIYTNREVASE